jgi:hypothetical protein
MRYEKKMIKKRVAFFIRAYNDIDHFVPLIVEFIKKNENPLVVLNSDIEFEMDYRIKYISTLGKLEIYREIDFDYIKSTQRNSFLSKINSKLYSIRRNRKGVIGRIYRKLFFNCMKQMDFLREKGISSCVFEWSTPFARGEIVEKYFIAAKGMGLTTFAIPHGCNIFINSDVTTGYRGSTIKGKFVDQSDTQYFDYYIFQNPIRRDGWIKWGFSPIKTQAWGSLRFYPEWADINREICPKFDPGDEYNKKVKVVFMQFQKEYNVNNKLVLDTLKQVSQIEGVALAVKDATREGKEFYDRNKVSGELGDSLIGWYGNEVHSPSLISWADCVIVIGGSIGVEVMLQNKHLIYPVFLNTNKTMYEYYDAALCVDNVGQIKSYLDDLKAGKKLKTPSGVEMMLKEIIYAGKDPYDVPMKYYDSISNNFLSYMED